MATATVRFLGELLCDLSDEQLLTLVAPENRPALREFLNARAKLMCRPVSYDGGLGLLLLIKHALGEPNKNNFHPDITQDRFPLRGDGLLQVRCRVEAYLEDETPEQAAKRLTDAGHVLANTGDLAGFLHDHPDEVERWSWVEAVSEDSRWTNTDGNVFVPDVYVRGADRYFGLYDFHDRRDSGDGVLVLGE